ncbi:MAG: FAD-dependent oxidoreductase [Candidatus Magnetominusculus sp. LBB02]|nr:FAD-dependent oxidoreductase [Candidatus Magnetominusculus sp. LBB02]
MKNREAVILGAGITGLAAAWKLAHAGYSVTIVEKEDSVGGLAGTVNWDGWRFDYGPHNFHTNDQNVIEFYRALIPDIFLERKPTYELYIFDKLMPYPLMGAKVFFALSGKKMTQAFFSFLLTRVRAFLNGIEPTDHLDEWIIRRFGKVMYALYFYPYIEKLWRTDPHRLSKVVGEKKIPILRIREYIRREIFQYKTKGAFDDLTQWESFYVKHGVGEISKFLYERLAAMDNVRVYLGEEVQTLATDGKSIISIKTSSRSIDVNAGVVISTLPIQLMTKYISNSDGRLAALAGQLEYCSVRVLFMKVRCPRVMGNDWTYFSENKFPFNRVSEYRYDKFEMVPEGHCSLTFEYPANEGDALWMMSDKELFELTYPHFSGIFKLDKADILDYRTAYLKYSYPRFTVDYQKILKEIFALIDGYSNLYSIGRQGMFCYVNVDGATAMGFDAAEELMAHPERTNHRLLLKKYHDINV